jgi:bifunctional UDP-N-acetylglucosamine pyrophosphorylase/glucosamine-1-phosphate N-acetyltransferase
VGIVLAAGDSTRMNSKTPKVLHSLAGQPLMEYALKNVESLSPSQTYVVVGAQAREVARYVGKRAKPILQNKRLGTGHAVSLLLSKLRTHKGHVLVHHADACLVRPQTVLALRQFHLLQAASATLLAARVDQPFGYGRIVRGAEGQVERIVQERDATEEERLINEISAGVFFFKSQDLAKALVSLKAVRTKGEFYLTDAVRQIIAQGGKVHALMVPDRTEVLGVNNRNQLAQAHRLWNLRRVEEHQRNGVTFLNPKAVEVGPAVEIGRDTVIEGNVRLSGETEIGEDCRIEGGSVVDSSRLGQGVVVRSSRIVGSRLGDGCDAGPFAHIRGGCALEKNVHVGTNTELKNARIGAGSKLGHFSYAGDAVLGRNVNVGAGCVFANYDGKNKHECRVGDRAFLGSNSTLVAPVSIGPGAVVAAGAVVTRNVPAKAVVAGVPAKSLKKNNT